MLSEELRNIYKSNHLAETQFKQSYDEYCGEYKKWLLEYKNDIISSFIRNKKEVAKSVITSYLTPKRYKENSVLRIPLTLTLSRFTTYDNIFFPVIDSWKTFSLEYHKPFPNEKLPRNPLGILLPQNDSLKNKIRKENSEILYQIKKEIEKELCELWEKILIEELESSGFYYSKKSNKYYKWILITLSKTKAVSKEYENTYNELLKVY